MASINTRILVTNQDGTGRYLLLQTFPDRLTITDESTNQVMTIALTTSVTGDNNGDQTASTVPLESTWGVESNNVRAAVEEISGELGSLGGRTYLIRQSDPLLPDASVMGHLETGILKNTNGTGVPSIATPSDFPVLNQSTTGNAATVTNGVYTNGNQAITGTKYFYSGAGLPIGTATASANSLEVYGTSDGAAMMTFHRPGFVGGYFGIDTDNQLSFGGWSYGAVSYKILHSGNFTTYALPLSHAGTGGPSHAAVTSGTNGFMTAADKSKLDSVAANANNYTHPVATITAPTLINSWANYNSGFIPAGYSKSADNVVTLEGVIMTGANGTVAFTLPSGYRPSYQHGYRAGGDIDGNVRVDVCANGDILINQKGTNTHVFLSGITFKATQ